jgi:hypothetical protein
MRSRQDFPPQRQEHRPIHEHDEHSPHHDEAAPVGRPGHNAGFRAVSQWQDPKTGEMVQPRPADHDLDLVEQEFYRSALTSADPTSLLRLARIPFVADIGDGKLMRLLSVSVADEIEVGAISPGYGDTDVVYHPVPASRIKHSRNLRFVYHTPEGIRTFTYAEIRDLPDLA